MAEPHLQAGLWMGSVRLDRVSHVEGPNPGTASAAPAFEFPLLLHVDSNGQARLLKEVVMVWEGTAYQLYSDPQHLVAAQLRDSARRISSAAFDFPTAYLSLAGRFEGGNTLTALIDIPAEHPTNPFFHRYHPQHGQAEQSYNIQRQVSLQLPHPLDAASELIQGQYQERVSGLHRRIIQVRGEFSLQRISRTATLKDARP